MLHIAARGTNSPSSSYDPDPYDRQVLTPREDKVRAVPQASLPQDVGLVIDLLNGHLAWRERLVQEFVFASTTAETRVISSCQGRSKTDPVAPVEN